MSKKKYSPKVTSRNKKNIIDMSERKQLTVGNVDTYNVQELIEFIEDINRQMEKIEKEYYASNELIDRIVKRNFIDIIHDKCSSFFKNKDTVVGNYLKKLEKL